MGGAPGMKVPFCTDCDSWLDPLTPEALGDTLCRPTIGADYFFGPSSQLMTDRASFPRLVDHLPWIDSYAYEALVIGVFILACYLWCRYQSSIGVLFKMQTHRIPLEKVYEEQTLFFKNFLRIALALMTLLVVGIAIRLCDFWQVDEWFPSLTLGEMNWMVPAILAAVGGVVLYRYLANLVIGGVTRNRQFFDRYRFMCRVFAALGGVLLTPLFLLCALYDGAGSQWIIYLMVAMIALIAGGYLGSSYRFFVTRNVSILQWILYLCTVEIFPLSLLLFAGLRYAA